MPASPIELRPVTFAEIRLMRDLHRQEMNCQIRYDAHHERGFTAMYEIRAGGAVAGYGCVGDYDTKGKEVVTEFYLLPAFRAEAVPAFRSLIRESGAIRIECQTNDRLLTLMLFDFCCMDSLTSDVILFADATQTSLPAPPGVTVRHVPAEAHPPLQIARMDVVAEADGQQVGKAGFLCHYNPPYGDIWMEVEEGYRNRGIGSYLVQEAKRICYEAGRRPAARCNVTNPASRRTLERAGFLPCARILHGHIAEGSERAIA